MSSLQLRGGSLLLVGGALSFNPACCCKCASCLGDTPIKISVSGVIDDAPHSAPCSCVNGTYESSPFTSAPFTAYCGGYYDLVAGANTGPTGTINLGTCPNITSGGDTIWVSAAVVFQYSLSASSPWTLFCRVSFRFQDSFDNPQAVFETLGGGTVIGTGPTPPPCPIVTLSPSLTIPTSGRLVTAFASAVVQIGPL